MADPLTQLLTLLQGNRGWAPDVQQSGVRPGYGLATATGLGQTAKSPYERTLRPGESRSIEDLRDMLAEVILAGGAGVSPLTGLSGRQIARQQIARVRTQKPPEMMPGAQLRKAMETALSEASRLTDEMINAGRGSEKPSETFAKTDELSVRVKQNAEWRRKLLDEVRQRAGPDAYDLPVGIGNKPRLEPQ